MKILNWIELKQWIKSELDNDNNNESLSKVLEKINELENETSFYAYSDEDGYELIRSKSEEGVMVWTHSQDNNFVLLKVKKSAVEYQDKDTMSYDCNTKGIEVVRKLK